MEILPRLDSVIVFKLNCKAYAFALIFERALRSHLISLDDLRTDYIINVEYIDEVN